MAKTKTLALPAPRVVRLMSRAPLSTPEELERARRYYHNHAEQERAEARDRYKRRKNG